MSHAPVLYGRAMVEWLSAWSRARGLGARVKALAAFRPTMLAPVIGLLRGLTDPVVGLSMGQTAENLAYRFSISREQMDAYALQSHQRLARAHDQGRFDEMIALYDTDGKCYTEDSGLRRDSSMQRLGKLKPVFDRPFGQVTAGNSAQITDGAACLLLASETAIEKYDLQPVARIIDTQWAGLDPAQMGLGPLHAMTPVMQRQQYEIEDIDYWEINEAFAAQVLACVTAWNDKEYCQTELAITEPPGLIPADRLNIDGGGVSIGHPVGASGARIVLHLLKTLQQKQARRGMASLCIGGGQGGAMLIERLDGGYHD
jgi:acetyl-CoA C-acetyltransferase